MVKRITFFLFVILFVITSTPFVQAELGDLRESQASTDEREEKSYRIGSKVIKERGDYWYRSPEGNSSAQFVGGVSKKLARGLGNFITSPFELGFSIQKVSREEGFAKGMTKGVGLGIIRVGQRAGVGFAEVITFPFMHESGPWMEPEYTLKDPLRYQRDRAPEEPATSHEASE
jgi:putative exosortase-associated protein (TIGR04073 family)